MSTPYHLTESYRRARREKYAKDAEFREQCIARATETRKRSIRQSHKARLWRARLHHRAENPERHARVFTAVLKGKTGPIKGLSLPALAEMLERRPESLREWIDLGIFPAPVVDVNDLTKGGAGKVYTLTQAARITKAFAEHIDGPISRSASFSRKAIVALLQCV